MSMVTITVQVHEFSVRPVATGGGPFATHVARFAEMVQDTGKVKYLCEVPLSWVAMEPGELSGFEFASEAMEFTVWSSNVVPFVRGEAIRLQDYALESASSIETARA